MADSDRMKRRLLREAVQENLDVLQGVRRRSARRAERAPWLRSGLFLLIPAALFGASLLLPGSRRAGAPLAAAPTAPPPPVVAPNTAGGTAPDTAGGTAAVAPHEALAAVSLPAPAAVDPAVFALEVRRVVLDPGHGGDSHGAQSGDLREKELTLDIAQRLRRVLEARNFAVALTRDADRDLALGERVALANREPADIFVSIHLNWFAGGSNRGVETYYLGPTEDPFLKQLAESENRDSGYSLADFRRLLEGVYTGVRMNESRRLAESVQEELFDSLAAVSPGLQNRGVKTAPFIVLVGTGMPAILAEVSCLSSQEETALLRDPAYRQRIADALADGISGYARTVSHDDQKGT